MADPMADKALDEETRDYLRAHGRRPNGHVLSKKMAAAQRILEQPPHLPSPAEVEAAQGKPGGWTAAILAGWGISWPPKAGWRRRLEQEWVEAERARMERVATYEAEHPPEQEPLAPVWQSLWQGGVAHELFIGSLAFLGGPDLHLTPIMLLPGDLVELRVKRAPRKP